MKTPSRKKALERIGRECVRDIQRREVYTTTIGIMPRDGFPRGQVIGRHTDGSPIRIYESERLLLAIQKWMAK